MGTPDADIATYLDTNVAVLTLGTNLFLGKERPYEATGIPHEVVFCLATGGPRPDAYLFGNTGDELRYPAVQIFIRSEPRVFDQTLVRAVRDAIHHASVSGYTDVRIAESEPNYIGEDEEGHHLWTINLEMIIEE